MAEKKSRTGQDIRAETRTFESAAMEHGLEPLQEDDYAYFFKVTGLDMKRKIRIKVLEVGCGSGAFGRRLAKNGYAVTGIDLSRTLVKAANDAAKADKVKYKAIAGDVFEYRGKGYDIVLCAGFLHHFTDLVPIAAKLKGFLRKNGHVVLIEPNGSNPAVRITETLRKNVWPFCRMSSLGTLNETSHTAEKYMRVFADAGFIEAGMQGFIKKPKFDDYGVLINLLLGIKYAFHVLTAVFMKPGVRGTVIVLRFRKQ
jgi:2-polyprenyl-3-methyl-5-hydroxy-6-metoxy-1,4-benzoquinol methylase